MPSKPGMACACGGVVREGVCSGCGSRNRQANERRLSSHERGYDRRWREYAVRYRIDHPWCVECRKDGRLVRSQVVDHVRPHRGDRVLFWEPSNHQALCKRCHDRKTARGQ